MTAMSVMHECRRTASRSWMPLAVLLLLWSACVCAAPSESPCSSAQQLAASYDLSSDMFYQSPEHDLSSDSICNLQSTCCSLDGERYLRHLVGEKYQGTVTSALSEAFSPVFQASYKDAISNYVSASLNTSVEEVREFLGSSAFDSIDFHSILSVFYGHLNTVIETRDMCKLESKFHQMFFELFLAFYESQASASLINTETYRECFYSEFLKEYQDRVEQEYNQMRRSIQPLLQYMRALETGLSVASTLSQFSLSAPCKTAIMQMTHCSQCQGNPQATPTTSLACLGLCTNVARGCLVDLFQISAPFSEYASTLLRFRKLVETKYNPWYAVESVELSLTELTALFINQRATTNEAVSSNCGSRKRSVRHNMESNSNTNSQNKNDVRSALAAVHLVVGESRPEPMEEPIAEEEEGGRRGTGKRRQTRSTTRSYVPPPTAMFNHSAYNFYQAQHVLTKLPSLFCSQDGIGSGNQDCWNGRGIGSYARNITGPSALEQLDNPEVYHCEGSGYRLRGQINMLKDMTRIMKVLLDDYFWECLSEEDEDLCSTTNDPEETCTISRFALPSTRGQDGEGDYDLQERGEEEEEGGSGDDSESTSVNQQCRDDEMVVPSVHVSASPVVPNPTSVMRAGSTRVSATPTKLLATPTATPTAVACVREPCEGGSTSLPPTRPPSTGPCVSDDDCDQSEETTPTSLPRPSPTNGATSVIDSLGGLLSSSKQARSSVALLFLCTIPLLLLLSPLV